MNLMFLQGPFDPGQIPALRTGLQYRAVGIVCSILIDERADYTLALHLTWPLYRDLVPIEEPFRPYFEMWKHGVQLQFLQDGTLQVCVPHLAEG